MTAEDRQKARDYINSRPLTDFVSLSKSRKGGLYVCPVCGSGTGPKSTGGLSITRDGKRVTCFAGGCFGDKGADTLGALRIIWDASETDVFRMAGLSVGKGPLQDAQQKVEIPKVERKKQEPAPEPHADYTKYIERAQKDLAEDQEARAYLAGRGLTEESIARFELGYDKSKKAIVIPYGKKHSYYIGRYLDPEKQGKTHKYDKPRRAEAGPEPLYNAASLYTEGAGAVFVVEGPMCAMSIMQAGGAAVAIGGTGTEKLLTKIRTQPTQKTLVLCLDNDEAGEKTRDKLITSLQEIGASYVVHNVAGPYKDPNEHLQADKKAFAQAVKDGIAAADQEAEKKKEAEEQAREERAYQFRAKYSAAARINDFLDGIADSVNNPPQPTGFPKLDGILDGGLYSGYVILTGGTSVGKTTVCLQIADSMAKAGRTVLYFTLEMTASDLMARSISRLTYENCKGYESLAKTARHITDGVKRLFWSAEEDRLVRECTLEYTDNIAPNICFIEPRQLGKDFLSTDDVKTILEEYAQGMGPGEQGPAVVIDYAQLLRPPADEGKISDAKLNMSNVATVLYHISKQYNVPVIAITSQPRSEYGNRDSMNAGKESGDLEYSAEYLFRLQFPKPKGKDESESAGTYEKKQKKKDPRKVELAIMKNRSGPTGDTVCFDYHSKFNCFVEKRILEED